MSTSAFLGLRTTIYKVADLQAATIWYTKAFQTPPYFNEPFYVGFTIAGYELGLQTESQPINARKSENILTYWGVANIQKEFDRLLLLGATAHETPNNVGGPIMVASLKDPWDNLIGLIYNPTFEAK